MKESKVGVIVRKRCKNNSDNTKLSERAKKQSNQLRAADPEAHQKFVNNIFAILK